MMLSDWQYGDEFVTLGRALEAEKVWGGCDAVKETRVQERSTSMGTYFVVEYRKEQHCGSAFCQECNCG